MFCMHDTRTWLRNVPEFSGSDYAVLPCDDKEIARKQL